MYAVETGTVNQHRAAVLSGFALAFGGEHVDAFLKFKERVAEDHEVVLWPADHPNNDVLVASMGLMDCYAVQPVSDTGFEALVDEIADYYGCDDSWIWLPLDRRDLEDFTDYAKEIGMQVGMYESVVTPADCTE